MQRRIVADPELHAVDDPVTVGVVPAGVRLEANFVTVSESVGVGVV